MDSTYENPAAHNDARIAAYQEPLMSDEAKAAVAKLAEANKYLDDWFPSIDRLTIAESSDETTAELMRLTRIGGIVGDLITQARSHTREASRISQRTHPAPDPK